MLRLEDLPAVQHSHAYEALARLTNRYQLIPSNSYGVDLLPLILPVTQLDELTRRSKAGNDDQTITSVGTKTIVTVPAGKRWRLHLYSAELVSGTWTINTLFVQDVSEAATAIIKDTTSLTLIAAQLGQPLILDQLDTLRVQVDSHSVNGTLRARYWYEEEDAY